MPRTCAELAGISLDDGLSDFELEPNPDISGIGVLIGFVATAWISFLFMVFHCLATSSKSNNVLDSLMYKGAKRILKGPPSPHWAQIMETVVLAMSDQQLVTGLAILISGFYQLKHNLTYYHWQMITTLAWFSSTTHLSSLMCLERYFQRHRLIWYARLLLMIGLISMLATAVASTARNIIPGRDMPVKVPAICLFELENQHTMLEPIIGSTMLLFGFLVRVVQMFSATRKFSRSLFDKTGILWRRSLVWACRKLHVSFRWIQVIFLPMILVSLATLVVFQSWLDLLCSRTFGISWLLVSLIWGTIRLLHLREVGATHEEMKKENTWEFGQLVPVLLLLVPFFLISEGYSEMVHKSHVLSEEKPGNRNPSLPIESQLHFQGNLYGIDESTHTAKNQQKQMLDDLPQAIGLDNDSLEASKGIMDCAIRISRLCKEDFRSRPCYQHTLFSAMTFMAAMATFVLPLAQTIGFEFEYQLNRFDTIIFKLMAAIAVFIVAPSTTTLYEIQSMLDSIHLTQRHSMSPVRLAIDPGKPYLISRCVFCLTYFVSVLVFSVCFFSSMNGDIRDTYKPFEATALVFIWALAFGNAADFCVVVVMNSICIYRQLF